MNKTKRYLIKTLIFLCLSCFVLPALAQKKPLDHSVYDQWEQIGEKYISNDGKYAVYTVLSPKGVGKLIVHGIDHKYHKEFSGGMNASITDGFVIFKIHSDNPGDLFTDTLVVLKPGANKTTKIPGIKSYKIPANGNGVWLAYQVGTELILLQLNNGQEKRYPAVADYHFDKSGNSLLIRTMPNKATGSRTSLLWINLPDGKIDSIMQGFQDARNFAFDQTGKQLAFIAKPTKVNGSGQEFYSLWYYRQGMDSAIMRADNQTEGTEKGLTISMDMPAFSRDGSQLFFGLTPIPSQSDLKSNSETAILDIWHYKDEYLQSEQEYMNKSFIFSKNYKAVFNESDNKVFVLTGDNERMILAGEGNTNYALIIKTTKISPVEKQSETDTRETAYLISTQNGSRKLIKEKIRGPFSLSPSGKFIVWYDEISKHYFTYDIATGITRNVTSKVSAPVYYENPDRPDEAFSYGIGGWIENDAALLIYDRYDIWQIDPNNIKSPVNITNGYGRNNNIIFRCVKTDKDRYALKPNANIFLTAFNNLNKYSGFFDKQLGTRAEPVQLAMGPYSYAAILSTMVNRSFSYVNVNKAQNSATYLVTRMNISEYPDLFITRDFKQFNRISSINPQQKEYNWMTAEPAKWKMFDGKEAEGILYKPENFDPAKKYPVIFHFYEQDADALYQYKVPVPSAAEISIPYFVSNGYLVFDPNIYYKIGDPGVSIYNSVVSAAKYLSRMPWVDSTKIGIQGHSYGGYQVSYLVTRTNVFSAAVTCSGPTDLISTYGDMRSGTGRSGQYLSESGQIRLGVTPWQNLGMYIKNSPLFGADKVTAPLLIMHNKGDGTVPFAQAVEYFMALRRLSKKVWMLQYDNEDHFIMQEKNQKDFSIRLAQFFDHFLKGAPAPKWISEGVPASRKGIDLGLEIIP